MTTAPTGRRLRLRAWTWHKHEWDGSTARETPLRRPTACLGASGSTVRKDDVAVPDPDTAPPVLQRTRPRCRSADSGSRSSIHETRSLARPSPLGLVRGGVRYLAPRPHRALPTSADERHGDKDADSHHDPSSSETEIDPSLSSSSGRKHAAEDHDHGRSRWWVRVIGIGTPHVSATPPSSLPPSFRVSTPRLLDEDRCLSPAQPRYLRATENSAAQRLSSSVLRRARHQAVRMVHQLGWWGVLLAALTLLEGPVVATTLLFALPLTAATLCVVRNLRGAAGRRQLGRRRWAVSA